MSRLVIACNFHTLKGLCEVRLGPRFCFDKEKPLKVFKMKQFHDYLLNITKETFVFYFLLPAPHFPPPP